MSSLSLKGILLAGAMLVGAQARAQTITFTSFGGNLQKGVVAAMVQPAVDALKIRLRQDTLDGIANVRVQVQSGSPTWDIVQLGSDECATAQQEGLLEKLDYSLIKTDGIPAEARGESWIASQYYSVVMAWNTDKYKDHPPQSWADFWDTEKFPGRRALSQYPQEMFEVALLADGVKPTDLYPIDVNRALAALTRIKPAVAVWWKSGAQSTQLIKDGEVDMIAIWGSRAAAAIQDGAHAKFTYREGLLGAGCFGIPKGSKNTALAQKVIAAMVSPEIQANIPAAMPFYGPVNENAFATGKISDAAKADINSSPENRAQQVLINADFWAHSDRPAITARYESLMKQ